jgi:hypothetical protein
MKHTFRGWAGGVGLGIALGIMLSTAGGQEAAAPANRVAAGDPYVPPAARVQRREAPLSGKELEAAVERKLRRPFDAADTAGAGRISRAQASAVGWGWAAERFDRIDTDGDGSVTYEEIQRYRRAQARR